MEGKIFRIGHMGYVDEDDLKVALGALERGLAKAGYRAVGVAGD
jgi:aspartate aminotransferase-like enzyme